VSQWASDEEINAGLKQFSAVSLLPSTISAADWGPETPKLMDAYLEFWEKWPAFPEQRMVIPVVSVKYGDDAEKNESIRSYLSGISFDARPGLGGVALPAFRTVGRTDVETWIQHQRVRELLRSPENAIGHLNVIFTRDDLTYAMQPLAEVQLARLLEQL
jgi:hypothetical protein